jgi:opacity protein-like surface antigen
MKRFLLAIALACVLSGSALAGDGHTVGDPAPGSTQGPSITTTVILTILSLVR